MKNIKPIEIKFYNSLTKTIEPFHTIKPGEVSMYVCGPTVYNNPSIGNMRPVVVFDTLRRFFEYLGYKVTYVSNFTDVDDKIINKALEEGVDEKTISERYIKVFKDDIHSLGSLDPTITPRVTEYIQNIIDYIANLVKLGAAYEKNGNVYFRVSSVKDYGSLSGISTDDLISGARIEENKEKESPLDFALWKATDVGIKWDSPWGKGRPGWHTECCVMIDSIFKSMIDIHGGGYDLKFPHHENEIAQAEATNHNKIARYWIHNAFVNVDGEKMSKSLGNIVLAKDLIEKIGGPQARIALLQAPYRQPINFTDDTTLNAVKVYEKIKSCFKQLALYVQVNDLDTNKEAKNMDNFLKAIGDDINTANALTELFEQMKIANQLLRNKNAISSDILDSFITIRDMLDILGISVEYKKMTSEDKEIYIQYKEAKEMKDFAKSDELRDILLRKGIF